MIKFISVVVVTIALYGCGSVSTISSSPERLANSHRVKFVTQNEVMQNNPRAYGLVQGHSCQRTDLDRRPSKSVALRDIKVRASALGANAVLLESCQPSINRSCHAGITCRGLAYKLSAT